MLIVACWPTAAKLAIMAKLPEQHPQNETMWMPEFYRKRGYYHSADGEDVTGLDPPSSTFPKIPKSILDKMLTMLPLSGRMAEFLWRLKK